MMEVSFSQFGEDIVVRRLASEKGIERGFYVDAGACHPIAGSNTLMLYKAGWRGINIEMVQEKVDLFNRLRPGDRNVCAALDRVERPVYFSTGNGGMDQIFADARSGAERSTTTRTLDSLLAAEGIAPRTLAYLNIDCERVDLRVLQGLTLTRYPVRILSIEALDEQAERDIRTYAESQGLRLVDKVKWTLVFES